MDIKAFAFAFAAATPPLAVIAAVKFAGFSPSIDTSLPSDLSPTFLFSNGSKLRGAFVLLRYVGRAASLPNFYGQNALETGRLMNCWSTLQYSHQALLLRMVANI